jgi:hypothetical protein
LEYTINILQVHLKYIEIYYKYIQIHSNMLKYFQIYLNTLQIQWSTQYIHPNVLKKHTNTLVLLKIYLSTIKIHSYILIYIKMPSKYIAIPSLHAFGICYNTINVLLSASIYFEIVMQPLYSILLYLVIVLFFKNCPSASLIYKNVLALAMTYLLKSNKSSIFHESHKSYWLFEYLNP